MNRYRFPSSRQIPLSHHLHTADPVPPCESTEAPAAITRLLQEGIGARNVQVFLDALRLAPRQVHALRFTLLEDIPVAALAELLAVLDGLPHLSSLEIEVSQLPSGRLSAVKRQLFAQSPVCVRLSLQVRRYLVRDADWQPTQDRWWRAFFEEVDWQDSWSRGAMGIQQTLVNPFERMAWGAFRHGEYHMLQALKTVCPDVYLSFVNHFPSQREIHLLRRIGIAVWVHVDVKPIKRLGAACRLLRDRRVQVTKFHVVMCVDVDARATGRLLRALSKARYLRDLSISNWTATSVTWPRNGVLPLPFAHPLEHLRLNVHAFARQLPVAIACLQTWSSHALHLLMPRSGEWKLLGSDGCVSALRRTQRVILHFHEEKRSTTEVSSALQNQLNQWLEPGHETQTLHITFDSNESLSSGGWGDWVSSLSRPVRWPLKALSIELRVQWQLDDSRTLLWSLEDAWREDAWWEAFHSNGAKAFFSLELKLVDDVWHCMATNQWLSVRDAAHLAQVSRRTHRKADAARREAQLAELGRFMAKGQLTDDELTRYTRSRLRAAADLELINDLNRELESRQAGPAPMDQVTRLRARSAVPEVPATPSMLVRYKA